MLRVDRDDAPPMNSQMTKASNKWHARTPRALPTVATDQSEPSVNIDYLIKNNHIAQSQKVVSIKFVPLDSFLKLCFVSK